jgi:hypothetical protein
MVVAQEVVLAYPLTQAGPNLELGFIGQPINMVLNFIKMFTNISCKFYCSFSSSFDSSLDSSTATSTFCSSSCCSSCYSFYSSGLFSYSDASGSCLTVSSDPSSFGSSILTSSYYIS